MAKAFTELSQAVSRRLRGREYTVVSLPEGMEIADGGFEVTKIIPTIAVVDIFHDFGNVKIGRKTKVHHGDIVTKYAVSGLENKVGVLAFDVTPRSCRSTDEWRVLLEALTDLAAIQKQYGNLTALNLSVGVSYPYDEISKDCRFELTADNIEEEMERLFAALRKKTSGKYYYGYQMMQAIRELVDAGVEVYSASGNKRDLELELFSLSGAQHIVSAYDYEKANQIFSTEQERGVYRFRKNKDARGNLVSLTDGIIAFTPEEIASTGKGLLDYLGFPEWEYPLKGTSYACPVKLNRDLKNKL